MIQILLNKTNFDGEWAAQTLYSLFSKDMKVVILPLSSKTGWASDYEDWSDRFQYGSEYNKDLVRPFLRYGISRKNITILNHFDEDEEHLNYVLNNADVICLSGDNPVDSLNCLLDLNIISTLMNFDGILITLGAAASIQSEFFPVYDGLGSFSEKEGLGVLQGVDLEMDYQETDEHLKHIIQTVEDRNRKVIICPKDSGILLTDTHTELLGNAFIADENDLDEMYNLYNE